MENSIVSSKRSVHILSLSSLFFVVIFRHYVCHYYYHYYSDNGGIGTQKTINIITIIIMIIIMPTVENKQQWTVAERKKINKHILPTIIKTRSIRMEAFNITSMHHTICNTVLVNYNHATEPSIESNIIIYIINI